MNVNIEDLYLKGFMAYSAKNYSEAKQYWEKVLAVDPSHEKARRGLRELQKSMPIKRTSKDILQEIKTLYAAMKYPEALKLCELLIKKYPSNQDLVGLYRKIANRIQSGGQGGSSGGNDFENTIYFQKKAEEFVSNVNEPDDGPGQEETATQVEKLIQQGVAEYEAGTFRRALATWQQALTLDPGNRIARDYITNVKAVITKQGQSAAPQPKPARPSKEKLLEAYNHGLKHYQNKEYDVALEKWNFILQYHPNHKETLQCLEKTRAAIEKRNQHAARLEEARTELSAGNHVGAQSILMQLSIEAPDLEGLQQLREKLEERQQQINEIRSLELESAEPREASFSPSDDEITQYFTPDDGNASGARQVTRVIVPKKDKKPFNKLLAFVIVLAVAGVGVGGYFGWQAYQNSLQQARTDTFVMPPVDISWNSDWQRSEDFNRFGIDFANEGSFSLAAMAFERADMLITKRMETLQGENKTPLPYDEASELEVLKRLQPEIKSQREQMVESLAEQKVQEAPAKALEKAETAVRSDRFDEAETMLRSMLLSNQNDRSLQEKVGELYYSLALKKVGKGELHEALGFFKRAAVLQVAYETSRQHVEVIQRYFDGKISDVDKNQWFFFFLE